MTVVLFMVLEGLKSWTYYYPHLMLHDFFWPSWTYHIQSETPVQLPLRWAWWKLPQCLSPLQRSSLWLCYQLSSGSPSSFGSSAWAGPRCPRSLLKQQSCEMMYSLRRTLTDHNIKAYRYKKQNKLKTSLWRRTGVIFLFCETWEYTGSQTYKWESQRNADMPLSSRKISDHSFYMWHRCDQQYSSGIIIHCNPDM